MALDGAFLHLLTKQLFENMPDARIERIYQPARDDLVLALRSRAGARRLLISCRAGCPRIHFTENAPENPATPPMLCMLLRKHLTGARLTALRQPGLERVVFLDFDALNELGDPVRLSLAVEIMGRHSNIILINEDGHIIDAVKRVDAQMSSVRLVLPGERYMMPPMTPGKLDLTQVSSEDVVRAVETGTAAPLNDKLLSVMLGVSPVVCRELAWYAGHGAALSSDALRDNERERLLFALNSIRARLMNDDGEAFMLTRADTKKSLEFSFFPIRQYGTAALCRTFDSYSQLLDAFYAERDRIDRLRSKGQDLLHLLTQSTERISRKLNFQRAELAQSVDRDRLRIFGDLLNANLHRLEKGMRLAQVENFYEDGCPVIQIPLDPAKTPVQNAQKYYKDYRKAQTAEKILTEQIERGTLELDYLETVFDALARAQTERELSEIREELAGEGFGKSRRSKQKPPAPLGPLRFRSSDGFEIWVGRNNLQNDRLTLRMANKLDVWLHAKNIPGSHVIICSAGQEIPQTTLEEAAMLAAFHSKAKDSAQVPVDYTPVREVKKPAGAKPGFVVYNTNRTLYVTPQEERVALLRQSEAKR